MACYNKRTDCRNVYIACTEPNCDHYKGKSATADIEKELMYTSHTLSQYKLIANTYIASYNRQLKLIKDAESIIKRLFFVSIGFGCLWLFTILLYKHMG